MRSRHFTSTGVILKKTNHNEADKIVTIMTRDYGKIKVLTRGVRKLQSRKRGHLEIFNLVKFSASRTHGMDLLTEVQTVNSWDEFRRNLKKVAVAYFLTESLDKITNYEEKSEVLFNLLVRYLGELGIRKGLRGFRNNYVYEILTALGFWPAGKVISEPDKVLEEIAERSLGSLRVGKKIANY